jgi:hypothetical protein
MPNKARNYDPRLASKSDPIGGDLIPTIIVSKTKLIRLTRNQDESQEFSYAPKPINPFTI